MIKLADTDYPIHELFVKRWSPYQFANRSVTETDLLSLFEAARWAPSSYNEQPWRFIVARKEDTQEFQKLLSVLEEANQTWAQHASALVLTSAHLEFDRNGKHNKAAIHDLGAAVGYLSLEATARGLAVHQIIGIQPELAKTTFNVPDEYEVLTAFAIGYAAETVADNQKFADRDQTKRARKPFSEFVYRNAWQEKFIA